MCGRFNVTNDPLAELFVELTDTRFEMDDRFNIAPTDAAPVIVSDKEGLQVRDMQWWLIPYWSKSPRTRYAMFNARAENLATSNAFKGPFERRRCLVSATGFYEWLREGSVKQPWYMRNEDGSGMLFAGLWDRWRGPDGTLESFAIVTTAVHENLAFLHNRQPVMLSRDGARRWLDPRSQRVDLQSLFAPAIIQPLSGVPVSTAVNNSKNKQADCVEETGPKRPVAASEPPLV